MIRLVKRDDLHKVIPPPKKNDGLYRPVNIDSWHGKTAKREFYENPKKIIKPLVDSIQKYNVHSWPKE